MWPDIFVDAIPGPVRRIGRGVLSPLYRQARQACARATAITGITEQFVEWGLGRGGRNRTQLDRAFPIAYEVDPPSPDQLATAERFWDALQIHMNEPDLTVCYFGNVGVQLDLTHVVDAARILSHRDRPARFVLCGRGERLEEYLRRAHGLSNI
jgi:glycosyltransferase involved in cell wall biosynthesis